MFDIAIAPWLVWALLSALFDTAIFTKIGVEHINSDLATFIRTVVVIVVLGGILAARGLFQPIASISARTYVFLTLSGFTTGASWLCYFRAMQLGDAACGACRQAQRVPE
jgi:transporter family protein